MYYYVQHHVVLLVFSKAFIKERIHKNHESFSLSPALSLSLSLSVSVYVKMSERKARKSRSSRAGLHLPVGRIHRHLRKGQYAERISSCAPVFMAAVMEYLTFEILQLAGNAAKIKEKSRINPSHITWAIRCDDELQSLLQDIIIPQGGVLPSYGKDWRPKKLPKKTALIRATTSFRKYSLSVTFHSGSLSYRWSCVCTCFLGISGHRHSIHT